MATVIIGYVPYERPWILCLWNDYKSFWLLWSMRLLLQARLHTVWYKTCSYVPELPFGGLKRIAKILLSGLLYDLLLHGLPLKITKDNAAKLYLSEQTDAACGPWLFCESEGLLEPMKTPNENCTILKSILRETSLTSPTPVSHSHTFWLLWFILPMFLFS